MEENDADVGEKEEKRLKKRTINLRSVNVNGKQGVFMALLWIVATNTYKIDSQYVLENKILMYLM